jgi:hypothetical protein
MTDALTAALTAVSAAEATYLADQNNVASIQASIETATWPLAPAQAQVAADAQAYSNAVAGAITALQAVAAGLPPAQTAVAPTNQTPNANAPAPATAS